MPSRMSASSSSLVIRLNLSTCALSTCFTYYRMSSPRFTSAVMAALNSPAHRIVPLRSYVKGWKVGPSHYLNQDLATVWLDK